MANAVSFSSVNQQLDFTANAPITIDDTLVRALTGNNIILPSKSPISFADLSGKVGVANIVGPTSNSQASYFNPTTSTLAFSFNTDVYSPQILWSTTLPYPAVLVANGKTATLSLTKTNTGNVAANGSITAQLSYANTLIGSTTLNGVSLYSEVYPVTASWVNSPSANVTSLGFSAQTAVSTISVNSNVPGGNVAYSVSPMDGGVTISSNGVVLTASSPTVGASNARSYTVTATISLSNTVVGASSEIVNLLSQRYGNTFTMTSPGNRAFYANSGALTAQSTFSVSGVPAGGSIAWSSNVVSGTPAALSSTTGTATLSLPISNTTVPFNAQTSTMAVTATMLDTYNGNGVISSCTATVTLSGLTSGLIETWGANGSATGFTAQTVSSISTANVSAGSVTFTAVALTGNGTPSITSGLNASATLTATQSVVGSNVSSWSVTPVVSAFGSTFFTDTSKTIGLSAVMNTAQAVTISAPSSNVQVGNVAPVTASVLLVANVSNGTLVSWTANGTGSNTAFVINGSNSTLTLIANTYQYLYSTYTVTANCYDPSTGASLSTATKSVSLEAGAYGLSATIPASATKTGFVAQTSGGSITSSVLAGGLIVESNNAVGFSSSNTPVASPTSNIAVVQSVVGTNTQLYSISAGIYDTNNVKVADVPLGTRTYTATMNAAQGVTIAGPSSNVQIGQTAATATIALTANISSGTAVAWTATPSSGSATAAFTTNAASCTLALSTVGYQYVYSTYTVTANCYDPSTGLSLSANTKIVTLEAGAHGLVGTGAVSITQSGYTAQTATETVGANVSAGYVVVSCPTPGTSLPTNLQTSPRGTITTTMSTVGTNTQSYTFTGALYGSNNDYVGSLPLGTLSLTAQVNSYSFSSSGTGNSQIVTSQAGSITGVVSCSTSIPGGYFGAWSTTSAATLSGQSGTGVTVSYPYSSANPAFSFNVPVSFNLYDASGRFVTSGSNSSIWLNGYYLHPTVTISNAAVTVFGACTVAGSYTYSMPAAGGVGLSVATGTSGSASIGTASSNSIFFSVPVSTSVGVGSGAAAVTSGTASFTPTITYGAASYVWPTGTVGVSITTPNAAISIAAATNGTVGGFISAQTSYTSWTASCNASIGSATWTWAPIAVQSGSISGTFIQGTGNNEADAYISKSGVGSVSGSYYYPSGSLYSGSTLIANWNYNTTPMYAQTVVATVYDPALTLSGSTSCTTSNLFESVASITTTASANASIPSVSFQSSAALVSGTAGNYSGTSGTTTVSLDAVHTALSGSYNVAATVFCQGTAIATTSRTINLSATGSVPNYSINTPGSSTPAGFNFPQSTTVAVSVNGLTGYGDFVTYNGQNFGSGWSWATPGGSNSYINLSVSQGSVGGFSSTGNTGVTVWDPLGRFMWSGYSGNFTLGATVYNPALSVSQSNAVTYDGTALTNDVLYSGNCDVTVTSNTIPGGYYTFSYSNAAGYPILSNTSVQQTPVTVKGSNTGMTASGYFNVTSGLGGDFVGGIMGWNYAAGIMLNGQQIAGPWTGVVTANGYGTHGAACPLYSDWVIKKSWFGWKHFIRADQVKVGDRLLLSDDTWGMVVYSQPAMSEAVKVTAMGAGSLSCSVSAPLQTEGADVLAKDALNARVLVRDMGFMTVTGVDELGQQLVQHITMEGPKRHFWTGDEKICLFAHHNAK